MFLGGRKSPYNSIFPSEKGLQQPDITMHTVFKKTSNPSKGTTSKIIVLDCLFFWKKKIVSFCSNPEFIRKEMTNDQ